MIVNEAINYSAEFEEQNSIFKEILGKNVEDIMQEYSLSNGAVKMILNNQILEIPNVYGILKIIKDYNLIDKINIE